MRGAILGIILAAGLASAAAAADYVVVSSTNPALRPGLEVAGGEAFQIAEIDHANRLRRRHSRPQIYTPCQGRVFAYFPRPRRRA